MTALLPHSIVDVAERMALPGEERLRDLALHGELTAHLRRRLLEELAALAPASDPADEGALESLRRELGLADEEALEVWRRRTGLSLTDLHGLSTYPRRLRQASEDIWGPALPGRFLERRGDLDQVVLSLVRLRDADLAQELWFQLQEGEITFGEVVERHAVGADRRRRGVLGPVPLKRLHPVLGRMVSRYPETSLVPPLDIDGQVHLIRVESVQRAELDERVRALLLAELRDGWLEEQLRLLQRRLLAEPRPVQGEAWAS